MATLVNALRAYGCSPIQPSSASRPGPSWFGGQMHHKLQLRMNTAWRSSSRLRSMPLRAGEGRVRRGSCRHSEGASKNLSHAPQ